MTEAGDTPEPTRVDAATGDVSPTAHDDEMAKDDDSGVDRTSAAVGSSANAADTEATVQQASVPPKASEAVAPGVQPLKIKFSAAAFQAATHANAPPSRARTKSVKAAAPSEKRITRSSAAGKENPATETAPEVEGSKKRGAAEENMPAAKKPRRSGGASR